MNTKITTALLVSVLSLTSLSAMEMTTSGDTMMKDKMTEDGKMMKDDTKMMNKDTMTKDKMANDGTMMKKMNPSTNAGQGARGEHVTALQDFLIEKGFLVLPEGVIKGYFGGATKKALMKYQESVGVTPTGYFGPKTRMMMQDKMGMEEGDSKMKKGAMMKNDTMSSDGTMMKDTMAQ